LNIKFPYGEGHLEAELPSDTVVLRSADAQAIEDLEKKLIHLLDFQESGRILRSKRILILIPDNTRAFPTNVILPILLEHIERMNPEAEVKILIATGLHRPVSRDEIKELVENDISKSYEILNHSASDGDQLIRLNKKTSFGTPIEVNRLIFESDFVIGLGLIEPHLFAGYSGGRKVILPGVAGRNAIFNNHGFKMIANPWARAGILERNPIHRDMVEFMQETGLDLIVNVTLNKKRKITGLFIGDPIKAHLDGVKHLDKFAKIPFKEEADIVLTTNGGYPLDRDIYQTIKGMDTAASVVRSGGVIIIASECRDGLGGHEDFLKLVKGSNNPDEIVERIRKCEPIYDQWHAQILARILKKAKVILVSELVSEKLAKDLLLEYSRTLEDALELAYTFLNEKEPRIIAIPEGPYIIPVKRDL